MFIGYLKDMRSWILFILGMLGLIDTILWLDDGIIVEVSAVLYLNVLLLLFFTVFILWRYRVEMNYTKKLTLQMSEQVESLPKALPEAIFKRDQIMNEFFLKLDSSFTRELSSAREATATRSDYIASWVHEVKAPLTAMKLTIDTHRHEPVIRKIEMQWLRVHLLIDQQLSIARLPSLEADYVLEKTSVQQLVIGEVRELASWCLDKHIAVEFEGEDVEGITDRKWCRFIIRQVLTNAVKYSPAHKTIFISTTVKPTGHVELSIADEGPGILPHDLPRVFDKGFTGGTGRLHNAATGLGLYLAETVANKIGIRLTINSKATQGTTVKVIFSTENEFDATRK